VKKDTPTGTAKFIKGSFCVLAFTGNMTPNESTRKFQYLNVNSGVMVNSIPAIRMFFLQCGSWLLNRRHADSQEHPVTKNKIGRNETLQHE
jgi:hypothetical protein